MVFMNKDLYAFLLTIGVGVLLMSLPEWLASSYSPQVVPKWVWQIFFYVGLLITVICLIVAIIDFFCPAKIAPLLNMVGLGGCGGNAKVYGKNSIAEGGAGGEGGIGKGGDGGDAEAHGDYSYARGGDGGNAAQFDGRGGRRTTSPAECLNFPTALWVYGCGGAGANSPEYNRRLAILTEIRREYCNSFPDDAVFIDAGVDQVPVRWVNKRLEEKNENWQITMQNSGYKMQ